MASNELKEAIRTLTKRVQKPVAKVDMAPGCVYGAVIGERIKDLQSELAEVKTRLNGLIFLVVGAVVVQVVLRLAG